MKKVTDLEEVRSVDSLKKEVDILKRENTAAMLTINKLIKDISKKEEDIKNLKSMMEKMVPIISKSESKVVRIEISPEEEIAAMQLERLRISAQERTLTLEETRMFDLLVKNKRLSQDQSTINLSKDQYKQLDTTDLIQIAGKVESDESDKS